MTCICVSTLSPFWATVSYSGPLSWATWLSGYVERSQECYAAPEQANAVGSAFLNADLLHVSVLLLQCPSESN